MRCNLFPCPTPKRLEGASQVLGVRYSRQRKKPVKRLFLEPQASHRADDGQREREEAHYKYANGISPRDSPNTPLRLHTLSPLPGTPPFYSLCHLKGPPLGDIPWPSREEQKSRSQSLLTRVPTVPGTCHCHTSYHIAQNRCGQGPRSRDLALFVCFPAVCSGTWLQQTGSKWQVSDHTKRGKDKLKEGIWNSAMVTTH